MTTKVIRIGLWVNAIAWLAVSGVVQSARLDWPISAALCGLCGGLAMFCLLVAQQMKEKSA